MNDVLAQPTRARLFAALVELDGPVTTDALASRLGLHPNGVRHHLERLHDAGLVTRARVRAGGRGRPRDVWQVAEDAPAPGDTYANLSRWLASAVPPSRTTLRAVKAHGRRIGRELAISGGSPERRLSGSLARLDFQPSAEPCADGCVTYTLCNCPYRDAVRANQELVCTLHHGLTQGLLDAIAPAAELAAFVPKDPDEAGCIFTVTSFTT